MNNYIITYEDTDNLYRGIYWGQKFSVTANTEREAIVAFYNKNIKLLTETVDKYLYDIHGKVVPSGDDWIQYGNGRFTAKLADDQPKENSSEENQIKELQLEVERLKADKEAFERLSEKAKQAYSDLQGKRLDESIAYNKEYQRLQDEVDRLKADNARLKQQSEKMQTEMLELLKDLHKMDNMSRLIHDTKPNNNNG